MVANAISGDTIHAFIAVVSNGNNDSNTSPKNGINPNVCITISTNDNK
ncbi:MAG: hypothetical protein Q4P10_02955 [Methanomassiliicoccales archaeon]|nr:hypothetical protein [Methanomassiliicoccales archaeon]